MLVSTARVASEKSTINLLPGSYDDLIESNEDVSFKLGGLKFTLKDSDYTPRSKSGWISYYSNVTNGRECVISLNLAGKANPTSYTIFVQLKADPDLGIERKFNTATSIVDANTLSKNLEECIKIFKAKYGNTFILPKRFKIGRFNMVARRYGLNEFVSVELDEFNNEEYLVNLSINTKAQTISGLYLLGNRIQDADDTDGYDVTEDDRWGTYLNKTFEKPSELIAHINANKSLIKFINETTSRKASPSRVMYYNMNQSQQVSKIDGDNAADLFDSTDERFVVFPSVDARNTVLDLIEKAIVDNGGKVLQKKKWKPV